jgi:hypothetical protein
MPTSITPPITQAHSQAAAAAASSSQPSFSPIAQPQPMRVSSSERGFKCGDTQETNGHKGQQKRSQKYTIPTTFVNQLLSQNAIIQINQTNPKRGKCAENYDR